MQRVNTSLTISISRKSGQQCMALPAAMGWTEQRKCYSQIKKLLSIAVNSNGIMFFYKYNPRVNRILPLDMSTKKMKKTVKPKPISCHR